MLLLGFILIGFASANEITAFYEDFEDGDFSYNPIWGYAGGNFRVEDGELHHDGLSEDRYRSILGSPVNITANGNLTFSFRGVLKADGSPEEGRGIYLYLENYCCYTTLKRLELRIINGFTDGFPINHNSLSFGYGNGDILGDYITTNYTPNRDTTYTLKAQRQEGVWHFYVDDEEIGTVSDYFNVTSINAVNLFLVGSVAIDDINVTVEDDIQEVKKDVDSLLIKYSPVLYLHPEEGYEPREIKSMLENSDLKNGQNQVIMESPLSLHDISVLDHSSEYYLDLVNSDAGNVYSFPNWNDFSNYDVKVYGRKIEDENHYKHLQYFIKVSVFLIHFF